MPFLILQNYYLSLICTLGGALLIIVLFSYYISVANGGDYAYTKACITWLVQREMGKHDVTGLSLALVDDQQVL